MRKVHWPKKHERRLGKDTVWQVLVQREFDVGMLEDRFGLGTAASDTAPSSKEGSAHATADIGLDPKVERNLQILLASKSFSGLAPRDICLALETGNDGALSLQQLIVLDHGQ